MTAGWRIHHSRGDAATFHSSVPPAERAVTFHAVDRPTLVLGSAQRPDDVDGRVASALGVDVVGRRSGGGAVLLVPGEFVWMDVVIPAGDPRWSDDVGAAMLWLGDWWAGALASSGTVGTVHRDGLRSSAWSRQVCWAGAGTGEVLASSGGKLVGISQRRTRHTARFQTMCHLRWRPELVAALVASGGAGRPSAAELAPCAAVASVTESQLVDALLGHLPG
ncbi:MAG: lipoyl protein ligase domain-containing protein [Ilumatobacteraceae bacterium]